MNMIILSNKNLTCPQTAGGDHVYTISQEAYNALLVAEDAKQADAAFNRYAPHVWERHRSVVWAQV